MRTTNLFFLAAILIFTACNGQQAEEAKIEGRDMMASQVRALEAELLNKINEPVFDTATATTFLNRSREFASKFPKDTLSPEFLFKAADVARGLGEYHLAIKMWNEVETQYEGYRKAPEALFLQGFTYDNDLEKMDEAAKHYEAFLEKYPKHPIANDVKLLLEVAKSGKSADELIDEFESQQEE